MNLASDKCLAPVAAFGDKQPILIIFKLPIARGSYRPHLPMVTGTSSVTIHVGLNGRALATPVVESTSNLPSSVPPSPITSQSQNPVFKSLSFLSSAYNQQSFKYSQSSFENSEADIERINKNIVKGPKDCLGKLGSVKFAKKSRKPLPPSVVEASCKKEHLVTKLSPPIPKPRTHIPKIEKNDVEIKESVNFSPSHRRARTELKLDLKPVYDDSHLPKDRLKYQLVPNIVSMTRKENLVTSVNDGVGNNEINNPTFRVKKLISLHSSSEAQLGITDNHVPEARHKILDKLSKRACPQAPRSISGLKLHLSNPVSSANTKVENMGDCNISSLPARVSLSPVSLGRKSKSHQTITGNPLHSELISKFGNSPMTAGDVPRLRKVKTKEPKTVKELFPNYKLTLNKNNIKEKQEVQQCVKSSDIFSEEKDIAPTEQIVSYTERDKVAKVTPTVPGADSWRKPVPPAALEPLCKNKMTSSFVHTPVNSVNSLSVQNTEDNDFRKQNKISVPTLQSHHESLRVPWKPINKGTLEGNLFKRGAEPRASYTKIVCLVSL